ncbi:hypothetical protein CEXT_157201 [Caerostris extrusa]|uniref:Uncharacterized protein n=1 Tax=Caerostris extrusa TaxID=172846 RepID=A0AAV4XYC7_CAEEX|nr:hypothetical protein CEXT_157201 [Caerostris extrusa]
MGTDNPNVRLLSTKKVLDNNRLYSVSITFRLFVFEALPTLISELMSSKSDGDRSRTRARFEEHSEILDAKLNHLVHTHKRKFITSIKIYQRRN